MAWAGSIEQLDLEAVKRRQVEADRARSQFVKRLFRADPADPRLYHLVIDPTVLGVDATVRILQSAAETFFAPARPPRGPASNSTPETRQSERLVA